jgi:hypothetical protein
MEFLLSLKNCDNIFLRGNHEEYLIRALGGDTHAYGILMDNGFASTLRATAQTPKRSPIPRAAGTTWNVKANMSSLTTGNSALPQERDSGGTPSLHREHALLFRD